MLEDSVVDSREEIIGVLSFVCMLLSFDVGGVELAVSSQWERIGVEKVIFSNGMAISRDLFESDRVVSVDGEDGVEINP